MKLLIPGGAGYIGSHMVRCAQEHGCDVVVLDDFSTGHDWALKDCEILNVNLLDEDKLSKLLKGRYFDGVIHFAAKSLVGESVKKPNFYYQNNVVGTINLVNQMVKNNINNLVFSSTAAIFGNPLSEIIKEDHPRNPINPYGKSKLMVETILEDVCKVNNINATCLRYFNAAGAHQSEEIGEAHEPETHLIPNILESVLCTNKNLKVFGTDYNTHDGTCIRDYIHVCDLAEAHLMSLNHMKKIKGFSTYNLGNGNGFSVFDIISACESITHKKINFTVEDRRKGDPSQLVASSEKAKKDLNWSPKYGINSIIESAWKWHRYYNKIGA